jgi:hypothetical protein
MPSLALAMACFNPIAWAFKESAIAIPEASSAALLMRRPEESLSRDLRGPAEQGH